jgi:hypothetical protein
MGCARDGLLNRPLCAVCAWAFAAYPPLYPDFPISAMDTPLRYHEQELSYAGIDLPALTNSGKKVSHIRENSITVPPQPMGSYITTVAALACSPCPASCKTCWAWCHHVKDGRSLFPLLAYSQQELERVMLCYAVCSWSSLSGAWVVAPRTVRASPLTLHSWQATPSLACGTRTAMARTHGSRATLQPTGAPGRSCTDGIVTPARTRSMVSHSVQAAY